MQATVSSRPSGGSTKDARGKKDQNGVKETETSVNRYLSGIVLQTAETVINLSVLIKKGIKVGIKDVVHALELSFSPR